MIARLLGAFFSGVALVAAAATAQAQPPRIAMANGEFPTDFNYLATKAQLDFKDIATLPSQLADSDSLLRSPRFHLELGATGAPLGCSFALDQTIRADLRHTSGSAHDLMENYNYTSLTSGASLQYMYGFYRRNQGARDDALTALTGAGFGVLANLALEVSLGLRPFQSSSHTAFDKVGPFNAGAFTSEDMVINSAMVTGVSEYFDNKWYVAAPLYSLVFTEGFIGMGSDQDWVSHVIAGAVLGSGVTELLVSLRRNQVIDTSRWSIFPVGAPRLPAGTKVTNPLAGGIGISYSW